MIHLVEVGLEEGSLAGIQFHLFDVVTLCVGVVDIFLTLGANDDDSTV